MVWNVGLRIGFDCLSDIINSSFTSQHTLAPPKGLFRQFSTQLRQTNSVPILSKSATRFWQERRTLIFPNTLFLWCVLARHTSNTHKRTNASSSESPRRGKITEGKNIHEKKLHKGDVYSTTAVAVVALPQRLR